jgi:tetratricopeptide (TPR) repeat protein
MKRNWKLLLTGMISCIGTLSATTKAASLQEGVELRRIAEYCKEKNYSAVKTQIQMFLNKHPHSDNSEGLYAMLGDILFSEGEYQSALAAYNRVKKEVFTTKTEFRRIHCLHELAQYEEVILAACSFLKKEQASPDELPTVRMQLAHALLRQALVAEDNGTKNKFLELSKEQYKLLGQTQYADQTLGPLAHIYTALKEYPQAIKMYAALTEKEPKKREEYLLQIMQLQVKFDRAAAIETCQKIYALGGPAAPNAAFNQLSLLFQENRFRDIALTQEKMLALVAPERLPLAHYYVGKSLHNIGDFTHAAEHLEIYLSQIADGDKLREKNALLTVLHCAKETENLALSEKSIDRIRAAFPRDAETVKASLLHAQLCRLKGSIDKSAATLKNLLDTFDELSDKDTILYDYALLLYQQKKWLDSGLAFEAFFKQYPAHPQHTSAWRNAIQCHIHCIAEASTETAFVKKEKLCTLLSSALQRKGIFSPEEQKKMRFMLAAAYNEIHKYEKCLNELSEYMREYSNDAEIGKAYMLAALAHCNGTKDLDLFASYAEKALLTELSLEESVALHLNLFNTYLTLAGSRESEAKTAMMLKAADHLYQVLDKPVKRENQLWLADFYVHQYREANSPLFLDRAIAVLEKSMHCNRDKMEMEAQSIKLADLYGCKKNNAKRIATLAALTAEYARDPDAAWQYQRLAQFNLATAYREEKLYDKALSAYAQLISSSSHATSYFSVAAELDKALLEFSLLDRDRDEQKLQAICDTLKNLEIQRKMFSEPCHLEAALAYIDITAAQNWNQRVELLDQLKFNFSCMDDPLVQQYLSTQTEFPEKYQLYQAYMEFIAADALAAQAILAHKKGEIDQSLSLKHQAVEKLFALQSQAEHPRLKERIERSREALNQIL